MHYAKNYSSTITSPLVYTVPLHYLYSIAYIFSYLAIGVRLRYKDHGLQSL